jgi:hypothetical protein
MTPPTLRRARVLAAIKAEELIITAKAGRQKMPGDLECMRAIIAGVGAPGWRSETHYCALFDAHERAVPREARRMLQYREDPAASEKEVNLASDVHLFFSHPDARPTNVILRNELAASILKSGFDGPDRSQPRRVAALKSRDRIQRNPRSAS